MTGAPRYRFGDCEFDPASGELHRGGVTIRLRRQPATLLIALLDGEDQVLTREAIATLLWRGDVHVDTEAGINFVARQLRRALGDSAGAPRYLETLPRRGFRWLMPVDREPAAPPPAPMRSPRRFGIAGASLAAVVLLLAVAAFPTPAPRLLVQFGNDPAGMRHFDRDGMRELIVANLGRSGRSFEIVAPQLADAYLDRPFPQVRAELALDLLLHVSVRERDGHAQLHAKLVHAADGRLIWVDDRDFEPGALRGHQREVAEQIADAVRRSLGSRAGV